MLQVRPVALMPTLIRWWEALRAPEAAKWQLKYRVDWDATDGRNGGAQQTVWEILMEMEGFDGKAKEGARSSCFGSGVLEGLRESQSPRMGLGNAIPLPKEDVANTVVISSTSGVFSSKDA